MKIKTDDLDDFYPFMDEEIERRILEAERQEKELDVRPE